VRSQVLRYLRRSGIAALSAFGFPCPELGSPSYRGRTCAPSPARQVRVFKYVRATGGCGAPGGRLRVAGRRQSPHTGQPPSRDLLSVQVAWFPGWKATVHGPEPECGVAGVACSVRAAPVARGSRCLRKGKVESGVGHAQKTPLKGMRFESPAEAQDYLDHWEARWADTRRLLNPSTGQYTPLGTMQLLCRADFAGEQIGALCRGMHREASRRAGALGRVKCGRPGGLTLPRSTLAVARPPARSVSRTRSGQYACSIVSGR
jgi:hypothetical protein